MPDVDRLLARIGLDHRPAADLAGLRAVHRAFLLGVPYETLAIHLGEYRPLDLDALEDRVCAGRRGGYCFELNGLLGWLLEALGFAVERRQARVGPRADEGAPVNHLALVVGVPGEGSARWLADAGLGEGWVEPLALVPGVQAGPGRLGWTLERVDGGSWWVGHHPWGSFPGFALAAEPVGLDAFAPHHERLSCDPASSFMGALVVQAVDERAITTLRARTLTVRGPEVDTRELVADRDAFLELLGGRFGIDLDVLGGARAQRLWDRVAAQHAAWAGAA